MLNIIKSWFGKKQEPELIPIEVEVEPVSIWTDERNWV